MTEVESFTESKKVKRNKKKTTVMKFTNSSKFDFPLQLHFFDDWSHHIWSYSIFGSNDLSNLDWRNNTTYICSKARRKLWLLRRLQSLGLSSLELFDVYIKEVHFILEYAVPVLHAANSKKEASEIESIQKLAFRLILGSSYTSYIDACAHFSTETLSKRRQKIC